MELLNTFNFRARFSEFIEPLNNFFEQQQWFAIFCIIFISFIIERIALFIFRRASKLTKKTSTGIDDQVVEMSSRPVGNYILLFGLFLIIKILNIPQQQPVDIKAIMLTGLKIAFVLNTLWWLWRLTNVLGNYIFSKMVKTSSKLDDQLVPIFQKTTKIFILIIGAIYIIQTMGYSISAVVAGMGIGGLAVAMAAKDTLANLFGSIMLITDRPFRVGDWIKIGDDEGVVEQIGFRSTRIRTFPKTLISIPNSIIANTSINNFSQMPKRRVKMTVGVTYETTPAQMEALIEKIRDFLKKDSEVSQDFFMVKFINFGAYSLDILVYYFTKTTEWHSHLQIRQEINLAIMRIIEDMGLSIAFPTQTLYIKSEENN